MQPAATAQLHTVSALTTYYKIRLDMGTTHFGFSTSTYLLLLLRHTQSHTTIYSPMRRVGVCTSLHTITHTRRPRRLQYVTTLLPLLHVIIMHYAIYTTTEARCCRADTRKPQITQCSPQPSQAENASRRVCALCLCVHCVPSQ